MKTSFVLVVLGLPGGIVLCGAEGALERVEVCMVSPAERIRYADAVPHAVVAILRD